MITSFTANYDSALASDRSAGISESGAYVGAFKQAETYETKNGAQMMRFWFASKDGQETWIDICVTKTDGTAAFGMDIFNAMLVCMNVTEVKVEPGKARLRNQKINENAFRMRALEGKPIGLILQRENDQYTDQNGALKDTYRMNIMRAFEPRSRKTASELIRGTEAKNVDAVLKNLKDKDAKPATQAQHAPAASSAPAPASDGFDDMPW